MMDQIPALINKDAPKSLYLRTAGVNLQFFSNDNIPNVPVDKWQPDHEELFLSFAHGRNQLSQIINMDFESKAPKWLLFSNDELDQIDECKDDRGDVFRGREELSVLKKLDQCLKDQILREGAPTEKDFEDGKDPQLHIFDERLYQKAVYFTKKSLQDAGLDRFEENQKVLEGILELLEGKRQELQAGEKNSKAYKLNRACLLIMEINS